MIHFNVAIKMFKTIVKAWISFEIFSVIPLDFYGIFLDYFLPVPSLDHFQYLIQIISSIFFRHISVYNLSRLPTKASFSTVRERKCSKQKYCFQKSSSKVAALDKYLTVLMVQPLVLGWNWSKISQISKHCKHSFS